MKTEMKSARIAYLLSQYPAVNTTYLLREVRELRALGFDFPVISIRAADRSPEEMTAAEREEVARTFYVKPLGVRGALLPHLRTLLRRPLAYLSGLCCALGFARYDLQYLWRSLAWFAEAVIVGDRMRQQGIGHLHTHYSSSVALIVKRIFPVTISMTIHGYEEFENPLRFRLADKLSAAEFVCAISRYGRSQLMKACEPEEWHKLEVAPLGIDPAAFAPRPQRRGEVSEVICVGSLIAVKAQWMLIAALDRLIGEGRKVRLRLVGDGPLRRLLERETAARGLTEHVIFEGWQNQDRVRQLYCRADLFALSSFAEGVPVALMEAMALELPCVATRITGIPELIRDGVDGLLVPPSDEAALVQAIAALMDDAALRRRLGQSARQRVLEKYDLRRNAAHLAEIFCQRL
jgi:glycosyltransferase involved in cell wall biosynthesis